MLEHVGISVPLSICLNCLDLNLATLLSLHRLTSDLLDAIAMSSGIMEFVFTIFQELQFFGTSV